MFIWVLGVVLTLVKGQWMNLMGSEHLDLDIHTIATAYLFLTYGPVPSGIFAVGQGFLVDLFSGGSEGMFTGIYLGVFGAVSLCSRFFDLEGPKGQFIIVSSAVLVKKCLFWMVLMSFFPEVVVREGYVIVVMVSIAITGMAAPVVFPLFEWVRRGPVRREPKALEDEP